MTVNGEPDVGWLRRYRTTDLGAALLFGAAAPAAAHLGYAAMACMVIAGIVLTLTHRERRIERVGRDIWMVDSWWLFRPMRVRRRAVQPGRVSLSRPESGWLASHRTLLTVDGHEGFLTVERWRHPPERIYAHQLVTDLARWFGVPASGGLAPFDKSPDAPARWAALRTSLDVLTGVPGDPRKGGPVPYLLFGRRPMLTAIHVWVLLVGVGLMCVSRLTYLASGVEVFALVAALPLGALLTTFGLAGALTGRIRAEISPAGLHVERLGLRPHVLLHIPFTSVDWLGIPSVRGKNPKPTLQVGCGDGFANLTAGKMGLKPDAFEQFCGTYRRALRDWLDRRLQERSPSPVPEGPAAPPTGPVQLDDPRAAPNTIVPVLAQLAPRLSVILVGVFIVALFLLARGPAFPVLDPRGSVALESPHSLPFFGWKMALGATGFAAVAAAIVTVLYLFWCAPQTRWTYALMIPATVSPSLVLFGWLQGQEVAACWEVCAGAARPSKNWIEVEGVLGSRYRLTPANYHATCGGWQARLLPVLRKEEQP